MSRTKKPAPLSPEKAYQKLKHSPEWIVERGRIYRDFRFENFAAAMRFVNRVAAVAERIGHHPNILMHEYHFVRIETYTHLTGGLSNRDVALAQAISRLASLPQHRQRKVRE